jgi:hypothetical protein
MAKKRTQTTPKGYEIPVPKQGDVIGAFQQIAAQRPAPDPDPKPNQPDASPEGFKKPRGKAEP